MRTENRLKWFANVIAGKSYFKAEKNSQDAWCAEADQRVLRLVVADCAFGGYVFFKMGSCFGGYLDE